MLSISIFYDYWWSLTVSESFGCQNHDDRLLCYLAQDSLFTYPFRSRIHLESIFSMIWDRGQDSFSKKPVWIYNWQRPMYWKNPSPTTLKYHLCHKSNLCVCMSVGCLVFYFLLLYICPCLHQCKPYMCWHALLFYWVFKYEYVKSWKSSHFLHLWRYHVIFPLSLLKW